MKSYSGFEAKKSMGGSEPLPAGGYIAKIMSAKVEPWSGGKGESLVVSFDVIEGEYKDFFATQYRENTNEDKRWKGNYRVTVPNEADQWFDSQKRTFEGAMWAVEQSNPGYHWDWNEAALKGKTIGVIMRNKEWEINGNTGWTTEAGMLTDVESIRSGKFKLMKDKPLKNKPVQQVTQFVEIEDDSELPF